MQPVGVPLDVFDGAGVLSDAKEAKLVAASAVAALLSGDGSVPAKSVAEEAARHHAVAALAKQFSVLCEERLGKKVRYRNRNPIRLPRHPAEGKPSALSVTPTVGASLCLLQWYTHFEAWLLSRRAAEAGSGEPADPCVPSGAAVRKDTEVRPPTRPPHALGG